MRVINLIESVTRRAGWCGAVLIFPLIGALVYEVFSRYVLGRPTMWAFEISYMVMGAIFMLGMADALRVGQHVTVDILSLQLGDRSNAFIRLAGYALLLPVLGWLVWELSKYALNPVIWPVFTVWFVGFLLLILQVVAEVLKSLAIILGRSSGGEGGGKG
jgi:TRAP-type mannitol/chloroaromatic compound transport system permease small subunit